MKTVRQLAQYQLGPPVNTAELQGTINSTGSAPSASTAGLSCSGIGKVDLLVNFGAAAETVGIEIWLYDGSNWYSPTAETTITARAGNTRAYLLGVETGSMSRIFARVTTAATSVGTIDMTPQGE